MRKKQRNVMSKLFGLKKFLTVSEVAQRLSLEYGEEVTEADVLRFALDGHLKLTINIINKTYAMRGEVVDPEYTQQQEAIRKILIDEYEQFPSGAVDDPGNKEKYIKEKKFNDISINELLGRIYVFFEDKVSDIEGIWDLIMIKGARIIIEQKYQKLTGGPDLTYQLFKPLYVQNTENELFKLFELNDYMRGIPGTTASHEKIKDDIRFYDYEPEVVSKMMSDHFKESMKYRKKFDDRDPYCFFPTRDLPEDCVIGVRPQALIDFISSLTQEETKNKPLDSRKELSYLNVIGAILEILFNPKYKRKKFSSGAQLREYIDENFELLKGTSPRKTADIFADARRALEAAGILDEVVK